MTVLLLAVLGLLALTSSPVSANPAHERLAQLPEARRNDAFAEYMSKTATPCTVARSFLQGFTETRAAVWSVVGTNQKSYAMMVSDDANGGTRLVECEKLKAATQGKRECFRRY